ncbi:MAG: RagB/SusD family nutrient uptake outer membrane protein [Cyclobacteriaceae bacterium]|nr:RagB/SusD family nutrient uptake outer membrane protein [Cyclobacteriaceae bacterium]
MKRKITFGLVIVCLMISASCEDLLSIKETDLIAGDIALKTVENNESAIIGAYASVNNLMGVLLNSVFSDEVKTAGEFYNSATVHEWQYGSQDITIRDNYTAINPQYQVIDRANRVLSLVGKADSTRVGDNKLRSRLRGEALFLRAYAHFELFRFYCAKYTPKGLAMPYLESPSLSPLARIDMQTYFLKLNRDIKDAKQLLPASTADINRANIVAANGLHARIALYSDQWEDAEKFATNYIDAPGMALATIVSFPTIWNDASIAEQAFRTVRGSAAARAGSLYRNTSANTTNIGTVVWTVSSKLYALYSTSDVRRSAYFLNEPLLANASRPSLIIKKYAGGNYGSATENIANSKLMRTSEMLLIRAEARAELNKFTGANSAESDLNLLRANRITGYINVTLTSKSMAIDEVILERFKELAFEGHRFWDLKRRGLPVSRVLSDLPTPTAVTLPADDYRFALPIPLTEMNANRLMVQNSGY